MNTLNAIGLLVIIGLGSIATSMSIAKLIADLKKRK